MRAKKPLFVQYCAADFLAGTVTLSPLAELAYRRICDMIYNSGDELRDDDRRLAASTKVGKHWGEVKIELIDEGKITIENGCLHVLRCSKEMANSVKKVEQKKAAGRASGRQRKVLKDKESGSTAVEEPLQRESNAVRITPQTDINDLARETGSRNRELPEHDPEVNPLKDNNPGSTAVPTAEQLTVNRKHYKEEGRKERVSTTPGAEAAHSPAVPPEDLTPPDPLDRSNPDNLTEVGDRVLSLCGIQPETWMHDFYVIASWLKSGADPETDIYPTVKRLVDDNPNFTPPRSARGLSYFTEAVVEAKGRRLAGPNGSDPNFDPERSKWEGRVSGYFKRGFWIDTWGAKPGPGCQAPADIIEKYGPAP